MSCGSSGQLIRLMGQERFHKKSLGQVLAKGYRGEPVGNEKKRDTLLFLLRYCSEGEVTEPGLRCTTGNRVYPKRVPGVRIPPSPPYIKSSDMVNSQELLLVLYPLAPVEPSTRARAACREPLGRTKGSLNVERQNALHLSVW